MKMFLILIIFFAGSANSMTNQKIDFQWQSPHLIINVGSGFHINQEAPAKLIYQDQDKILKPHSMVPNRLIFDLGSEKNALFKVSFYICDDLNTSCELHKSNYKLSEDKLLEAKESESTSKQETKERPLTYNAHSFIVDDLNGALKKAHNEKKLLLVDFAAPWCPACVRLETEVFPKKQFKKVSTELIKVTLNADLESNREAYKKYDVNLLPSLILMNEKGEELYRMIDYKPLAIFNQELKKALIAFKETTESLTQKANKNDKFAIETLANRAMNMNLFSEALKWYERLGKASLEHTVAKIAVLAEQYEKDKDPENLHENLYKDELKRGITQYPTTYEALDWRLSLAEIDKKNAADNLKGNITQLNQAIHNRKSASKIFGNTTAGTISFPLLEAHLYLFRTYEKLGTSALKEEALKNFQTEIKKIKTSPSKPGELMQIIQYQREAQMPEEELALKSLVQAYPQSHVYHMKLGNFYFRHKQYLEALPELTLSTQLEKPVSLSNLTLLAKLQKELKLKEELKKTIELADNLFLEKSARSQEKLKQLHELLLPENK